MVVACLALFVALGGTGIAAVNFARNAGAVDGKSAVASSATLSRAAGKLVATASRGPEKGRIPGKFLAGVPRAHTFGASVAVADNAVGAPASLGSVEGIGSLTATCSDQAPAPNNEDPSTTITFTNTSGTAINISKRIGGGNAAVGAQAPNTIQTLTINGSNSFELHIQNRNVDLLVDGVVRQDGRGTSAATCTFYGTFVQVG
jgi:hypothetical protein